MKIKLQKMIAMFLLILLILPMLTSTANAFEYSDVLSESTREILKILSVYGLMDGHDSESFKPGNCVTRAEMAKISIVLLGFEQFTRGMESSYSDMKGHWAERYVDLINELGILTGNDDNTYEPNKYITYTESITAILKVLGYKDSAVSNNSTEGYMSLAKDLGLLKDLNNPSIYMTRETLAYLVYNALFTNTVEVKNDKIISTGKALINNIGKKATEKIDDVFALNHSYIDLSDYMLNVCDVYYDINGKILLVEKPLYRTIEGYVTSAVSTNIIFLSDSFKNKSQYNLSGVPVIFNGLKTRITNEDLKNSHVKLLMDNKDSDRIIGAVVYKITDKAVIDAKSLYKNGDISFAGKTLPKLDGKVSLERVKVTGDATDLYDIQEDDLVYFYETKEDKNSKSVLTVNVIRKYVVGTYNGRGMLSYEDFFDISTKNYRLNPEFKMKEDLSFGDNIKAILDVDNKIIEARILKYNKEPEKYAMITDVKNAALNQLPIITIVNQQGKTVSLELRENSGEVLKEMIDRSPKYSTSLSEGNFVKYDLYDNDSIKIIKKVDSINIAGSYNNKTGTLSNQNISVGLNTAIIQVNNNNYEKINRSSLGNYIEGRGIFNLAGIAEILVLDKNYTKTTETQTPVTTTPENPTTVVTPPVNNKFSGTIYGAIQTVSGNTGSEKIKLFNSASTYSVDKNLNKDVKNFKNQFIKLVITNNVVTDIVAYSAEISKSKVTAIYSGQLQIDGISYVEYSKGVLVFTCKYDDSGNITSFSSASVNDIKINSTLKFYNINKNYNGVMDIIIIYN